MKTKRLAALFLSLAMLISLTPGMQQSAEAENTASASISPKMKNDLTRVPAPDPHLTLSPEPYKVGDCITLSWHFTDGINVQVIKLEWDSYSENHQLNTSTLYHISGLQGTVKHKVKSGGTLVYRFYLTYEDEYGHTYDSMSSNESVIFADGWAGETKGWVYYHQGKRVKDWVYDSGKWYFMNWKGYLQTGWVKDDSWYYMNSSGAMQTGWLKKGGIWYFLGSSGAMKTGWVNDGGSWYWMNLSGEMKTGWLQEGSAWYYLLESGIMATGTQYIDGRCNTFNASGVWLGYK